VYLCTVLCRPYLERETSAVTLALEHVDRPAIIDTHVPSNGQGHYSDRNPERARTPEKRIADQVEKDLERGQRQKAAAKDSEKGQRQNLTPLSPGSRHISRAINVSSFYCFSLLAAAFAIFLAKRPDP
jgi:hypothetical protein